MKKEFPLISVITTVYNTEKYVERCFDSVLNQSYQNIEFIVVDNASEGNIQEIVKDYRIAYPERRIKLVTLADNVGLFHGRLKGIAASTGDYIAFIDSDDRVSLDFYRALLKCALESNSDIAAGNVVLEFQSGKMCYENLVPQFIKKVDLVGEEISHTFWTQEGLCYYWHLVWNKLYRRDLIERALPLLSLLTKKVIMCDDLAYSTVFFSLSTHLVSTQMCQYYYYKRNDAYTANVPNINIVRGNIENIISVFEFMEKIQEKCGLKKYQINLRNWKHRMFCIWCRNVAQLKITSYKKRALKKYLLESFGEKKAELPSANDNYFYQYQTDFTPFSDYITKDIQDENIEYVSFDVFDTLIIRPLLTPDDLFMLMSQRLNEILNVQLQIDFCSWRKFSEEEARREAFCKNSYEDVTLDEIYEKMECIYNLNEDICIRLKKLEISLEQQYCKRRKYGYEVYQQAISSGKKIICISDMYLPTTVIEELLEKNGYTEIQKVFVSSEFRKTKHKGSLYKHVLRELRISPENLLHVGDNEYSDNEIPQKLGIKTMHIPKAYDVWKGSEQSIIGSDFFSRCFNSRIIADSVAGLNFLGNRLIQGTIANNLYDNPFYNHNILTDFDLNPHKLGYALLGPYLFAMVRWLYESAISKGYNCIHFIARDGFLMKQAFEKLQPYLGKRQLDTSYLYVSRKALIPLMVCIPEDIFTIESTISFKKNSPKDIIELLRPIIEESKYAQAEEVCNAHGVDFNDTFENKNSFLKFLQLYIDVFYSRFKINEYRNTMKQYFSEKIGECDCFFDIGYSGRTESLLGKLLGCKIDTFYLHLNNQVAIENSKANNFQILTYFDYSPILQGPIREMLFSAQEPSCIGYEVKEDFCKPVFEEKEKTYIQMLPVHYAQSGALDFLEDFIAIYGDIIYRIPFRNADLSWPLEYFLANAKPTDLMMFSGTTFEDDLFLGKTISVEEYWIRNGCTNALDCSVGMAALRGPKWKKAVYYALFDRKTLKEKVKDKYASHPVLLNVGRVFYSIPRGLYHYFRKKQ